MNGQKLFAFLGSLMLLSCAVACQSEFYVPYIMPKPPVPDMIQRVFTPADMQRRIAEHPAEFRQILNADTVILFAYPHPILDWASSAFLIHIPSMSEVGLTRDATIQFEQYGSDAGKARLQQLLADQTLMDGLKIRMQSIWQSE